jgi:hypothetical protein
MSNNITRAMFQAAAGGAGDDSQFMWSFGSGSAGDDTLLNSVGVDSSDNIIVVGTTLENSAGNYDVFVAKIRSDGNILWKKTYGKSGTEQMSYGNISVVDPSDGSVYIVFQNSSGELALVNISSSGSVQKETRLSSYDINDARIWLSGSFVYVGGTDISSLRSSLRSAVVLKIEKSNLLTVSTSKYYYANASTNSYGSGAFGDSSNNFYAIGWEGFTGSGTEGLALKFNSSGSTLASRRYGGSSGEAFSSGDFDGTYLYASGYRTSNPAGAWLLKLNSSDLTVADSVVCTDANSSPAVNWNSSLDEGMWPVEVSSAGVQFIKLDSNLDELNSIRFELSAFMSTTLFNGTLDSEGNMIGVFSGRRNTGDAVPLGFLFKVGPNFQGSGTILGVTYDQQSRSFSTGAGTNTYTGGEVNAGFSLSNGSGYTFADANIGTSTAEF